MSAIIKRSNPEALGKIHDRFRKIASREIAVGFPKGKAQAYPDGTSVIDVAARHVFGVGVPKRDFMALAKPGVADKTAPILAEIMALDEDDPNSVAKVKALQEAAGLVAQQEIQNAIIELSDPPNSPATIEAKGSNNPLIDTAHMKDSVTFVVRDKR